MPPTLRPISLQRLITCQEKGWTLAHVITTTFDDAITAFSDADGFLPDDHVLVKGSRVQGSVFEFMLFSTPAPAPTHLSICIEDFCGRFRNQYPVQWRADYDPIAKIVYFDLEWANVPAWLCDEQPDLPSLYRYVGEHLPEFANLSPE